MDKRKQYDDDDGRTIADMSDIARQPLLLPRFKKDKTPPQEDATEQDKPWENNSFSKEERRSYIFGALGATFLIGAVFAVAFLILIILMVTVWR